MQKSFDGLIEKVNACGRKKVAVAVAQDAHVLEAVQAAKERGIADSILVADRDKMEEIAANIGMNIEDFEVIHVEEPYQAALKAVSLVQQGKADMYMKGKVDQIIITGGIAYDKNVMGGLRETCEWIAPMTVYPGEDELLALVQGGLRVMRKEEEAKVYA